MFFAYHLIISDYLVVHVYNSIPSCGNFVVIILVQQPNFSFDYI